MEYLIKEAFLHIDVIGPHVADGHYDLVGPNNEIIMPSLWEVLVEPGWHISMHMWPIPEPQEEDAPDEGLADAVTMGESDRANVENDWPGLKNRSSSNELRSEDTRKSTESGREDNRLQDASTTNKRIPDSSQQSSGSRSLSTRSSSPTSTTETEALALMEAAAETAALRVAEEAKLESENGAEKISAEKVKIDEEAKKPIPEDVKHKGPMERAQELERTVIDRYKDIKEMEAEAMRTYKSVSPMSRRLYSDALGRWVLSLLLPREELCDLGHNFVLFAAIFSFLVASSIFMISRGSGANL